jgi:hypothetical protein
MIFLEKESTKSYFIDHISSIKAQFTYSKKTKWHGCPSVMYGQGAKNKHPIYDDKTINIVNDMYKHFHNDVGKLFMYF